MTLVKTSNHWHQASGRGMLLLLWLTACAHVLGPLPKRRDGVYCLDWYDHEVRMTIQGLKNHQAQQQDQLVNHPLLLDECLMSRLAALRRNPRVRSGG